MGFVGTTTLVLIVFIGRAIMIAAQPSLRGKAESFMIVALISVMAFFIETWACVLVCFRSPVFRCRSSAMVSMVVNYMSLGIMLNISMTKSSAETGTI